MKLQFFLLADFANESGGKLNIIGTFNTISAQQFPVVHPTMYLVAKIVADPGEHDVKRAVKVLHLDEGENEPGEMEGEFTFPKPAPEHSPEVTFIFGIRDMQFEKPSRHEFQLLVDNVLLGVVPLRVVLRETAPQEN